MSEKYRLIKHNKNLAEIENDRGVGLLFLVDEDCERKLEIIVDLLNEQQDKITELEKNFDDLVKYASEIAKRNVLLDERIGKIQQAIKRAYEEKPYPTFEDIQAKIKELNDE